MKLLHCPRFLYLAVLVVGSAQCAPVENADAGERSQPPDPSSRRIAVTFDDLPGTAPADPPCIADSVLARNRRLLSHVAEYRIRATGFVNEGHCSGEGASEPTLALWLEAGHTLGNHTYSHFDLNDTSLDVYIADLERGAQVTRRMLADRGQHLRYFRHPFLHTGADPAKWHGLQRYLDANGYIVAPVTIDNQEWIFEAVYRRAMRQGDRETMRRVADAYVPFLESVMAYFEAWSAEVVGYEPPQILLLHDNEINADHFDRVASMLQRRGYDFISIDEALADAAYELPDGYIGPRGLSWVHRWALGQGMRIDHEEPREPAWLAELFETYPQ